MVFGGNPGGCTQEVLTLAAGPLTMHRREEDFVDW